MLGGKTARGGPPGRVRLFGLTSSLVAPREYARVAVVDLQRQGVDRGGVDAAAAAAPAVDGLPRAEGVRTFIQVLRGDERGVDRALDALISTALSGNEGSILAQPVEATVIAMMTLSDLGDTDASCAIEPH